MNIKYALFITILFYIIYLIPTMANQEVDWRFRREQAQPIVNKFLRSLLRKGRLVDQRTFLYSCKRNGVIPKGLRVRLPSNMNNTSYGFCLRRKNEFKILKKSISELHRNLDGTTRQILVIKLELREFELGEKWLIDIENHFMKRVRKNSHWDKKRHDRKLQALLKEKRNKRVDEQDDIKRAKERCKKKIVYNNSKRVSVKKKSI